VVIGLVAAWFVIFRSISVVRSRRAGSDGTDVDERGGASVEHSRP
jgi:hypothetical protein